MKFSNLLKKTSSVLVSLSLTLSPINAHLGCKIMTVVNSVMSAASGFLFSATILHQEKKY